MNASTAFLLGSADAYEETFHRLCWKYPGGVYDSERGWDDILGFQEAHRKLPIGYGKNCLFSWADKGAEFKWPDLTDYAPVSWMLISERMAKLLHDESESPEHYQLIEPVYLPGTADCSHMGYKLLKLNDWVPCLDIQKSDLVLKEDGSVDRVFKYVLRHDAVEGLRHIFRVKEYFPTMVVSRQLGDALLKSRMTGFSLHPVELI